MIFWINIPMGLAALAITTFLLRRLPRHERPHRLDIVGAVLIVLASVSFMLALNLGGVRYPWTSPPLIALFAVAVVWALVRRASRHCARAVDPGFDSGQPDRALLDRGQRLRLGRDHRHEHHSADLSAGRDGPLGHAGGLGLVIFMVALNTSAGFAGQVLGRVRRYKLLPMFGLLLAIGGVATLALWGGDRMTPLLFELLLLLIGIGFGPLPSFTAVTSQNVVARHQLGISVGTMELRAQSLRHDADRGVRRDHPGRCAQASSVTAGAFGYVFWVAAASLTVALVAQCC